MLRRHRPHHPSKKPDNRSGEHNRHGDRMHAHTSTPARAYITPTTVSALLVQRQYYTPQYCPGSLRERQYRRVPGARAVSVAVAQSRTCRDEQNQDIHGAYLHYIHFVLLHCSSACSFNARYAPAEPKRFIFHITKLHTKSISMHSLQILSLHSPSSLKWQHTNPTTSFNSFRNPLSTTRTRRLRDNLVIERSVLHETPRNQSLN